MKTGYSRRTSQNNPQPPGTRRAKVGNPMRYLRHTVQGGLDGDDLEEAERIYVLWDWDGLALLAYEQFLKRGRGVLVGPRTVFDEDTITVAFDYLPDVGSSITEILSREVSASLLPDVDHYHPELDFVVVWLRPDGTARHEVFRSDGNPGFLAPRDLFEQRPSEDAVRLN